MSRPLAAGLPGRAPGLPAGGVLGGWLLILAISALLGGAAAPASGPAVRRVPAGTPAPGASARAAARLEALRDRPAELYAFLRHMPKGADLHNHLGGANWAESVIRWAAEEGACVDRVSLEWSAGPCTGASQASASAALSDGGLYRRLVDDMSMRNWQLRGVSGHDWFFGRFSRGPDLPRSRAGDMLAEARSRAAGEGVSYLELMFTPDTGLSRFVRGKRYWDGDPDRTTDALLAAGLRNLVSAGSKDLDLVEARAREVLRCDTPQADPGCDVEVRYLYQGHRTVPPENAFGRLAMGFEMASGDARVVGVNFVAPEDDPTSMRDFGLHMRMFQALGRRYPTVKVSLHAGELSPGLVPPEGLRHHIRDSVMVASASRIGHGVDVLYEDDPEGLMRELRRRGVAIEICLTSNDVILGVRGKAHPLRSYLDRGVPVLLATDDPGLSRSTMTGEYVKAVMEQGLTYRDLVASARNSLKYSFLDDLAKKRLQKRFEADLAAFERTF